MVPLAQMYTEPALAFLARHQAALQLRSSAAQIEVTGNRVSAVKLKEGGELQTDYYICTVPAPALCQLLPPTIVEQYPYFSKLAQFTYSPTTAIHLWFDREITQLDNAAFLGREIQWMFAKRPGNDKTSSHKGFSLALVVSASHKLLKMERGQILDIALRDLHTALPVSRAAQLLDYMVIKEPFATFSCRAGCDAYRPDSLSPLANFFISGDWTNTGWPATMEGAVRSGYRAAELILAAEGKPRHLLQPDLPPTGLAKWLIK
jgi:uncharacterized protein with NAD-binding domain and iron-sulfur cluster